MSESDIVAKLEKRIEILEAQLEECDCHPCPHENTSPALSRDWCLDCSSWIAKGHSAMDRQETEDGEDEW